MIATFVNREDCRETWAEIYRQGGEPLLRQWSKYAFSKGLGWVEDEGMEFHHGLRIYQTLNFIGANDDEVLSLIHLVPLDSRPALLDNPNCGVKIVETLWYGLYTNAYGEPCPDVGAGTAFMYHHDLAMYVYKTRPDLAAKLSPFLYGLFQYSLRRESRDAS